MSGGGLVDSSSSKSKIDPALKEVYLTNIASAQDVASTPFQVYTGELVAPFTPTQIQGQGALTDIYNNQVGTGTLNSAIASNQGLLSGITPEMIQTFYNPYEQQVVDSTKADLDQAYQGALLGNAQDAAAANAFGNDRYGIFQAQSADDYLRTLGSTLGQLRNTGWQNAAQTALGSAGIQQGAIGQMGQLSNQQLQQAFAQAGALNTVGNQQQSQQQAIDQAAYDQFIREWMYPMQMQGLLNESVGLYPGITSQKAGETQGILGAFGSVLQGIGEIVPG